MSRGMFSSVLGGFLIGLMPVACPPEIWAQETASAGFTAVRDRMLARFDDNGDGYLSESERAAMQKARYSELLPERKRVKSREEMEWKKSPAFLEMVARYDKDQDGDMNDLEWGIAHRTEMAKIMKTYDVDTDGALDKDEKVALQAAIKEERITGVPAHWAKELAWGAEGRERGRQRQGRLSWLQSFDKDGDGRMSAEELRAARKGLAHRKNPEGGQ